MLETRQSRVEFTTALQSCARLRFGLQTPQRLTQLEQIDENLGKSLAVWPMIGYLYPNMEFGRFCGPHDSLADHIIRPTKAQPVAVRQVPTTTGGTHGFTAVGFDRPVCGCFRVSQTRTRQRRDG
jgi:hypothetical protein